MELPVESKVLWAIEKQAKELIFPMFEDHPQPAASVEATQPEMQRKEPRPDAPIFSLSKSAEENYAFFVADRIGEGEEERQGFEETQAFMQDRVEGIDPGKLRIISFVFLNYQDVVLYFLRDLYPKYAEHFVGGMRGQIMQFTLATAMMMHTKESARSQLDAVDYQLKILQQIGSGNEKEAAIAMKALDPYHKVFMYIAHQLTVSHHRDMVLTCPESVEANNQLYAQLNRLGMILSGVLSLLNDDINP